MDDKAPGAFRTISEVADELDLPQHVLRFWESRFTDIKPMKRGGGRRYYRPDDIDLLRGIRHLLYGEGYTIRGVQRILREQGVDFVQAIWRDGAQLAVAAESDDEDAEETLEADDAEESEESEEADGDEDDTEDEEGDEPRGIRGRLTSLIGRDLNDRSGALADREDPPMDDPPMPRIEPGDRIGVMARAALPQAAPAPDRGPAPRPQAAPVAPAMSADQRERLRQVLDELKECRKRIDAALRASA